MGGMPIGSGNLMPDYVIQDLLQKLMVVCFGTIMVYISLCFLTHWPPDSMHTNPFVPTFPVAPCSQPSNQCGPACRPVFTLTF